MRIHIDLDDKLVAKVDSIAGDRGRTQFIREALAFALANRERWKQLESAIGSVPAHGHDWDDDPAAWIHAQRRSDARRLG